MANNHGGRRIGAGRPTKENQKEKQNKYIQFICSEVEKETIINGFEAFKKKNNIELSFKQYIKRNLLFASELYSSPDYQIENNELEQYYTKPEIAQYCVSLMDLSSYSLIVEPSAGTGAFLVPLRNSSKNIISMDIDPKEKSITKKDFFDYLPERSNILVIGNPPFGKNSSLAIRFINHAAHFADTIAFILPVSFKKGYLQNQLNEHLELVSVYDLPAEAFIKSDGNQFNYETAFFIFRYSETYKRELEEIKPQGFSFTKSKNDADIFIIRKGKKAGVSGFISDVPSLFDSIYYIKLEDKKKIAPAIELLNTHNWSLKRYSMNTINQNDVSSVLNILL